MVKSFLIFIQEATRLRNFRAIAKCKASIIDVDACMYFGYNTISMVMIYRPGLDYQIAAMAYNGRVRGCVEHFNEFMIVVVAEGLGVTT
jgi:hypothetical protein